MTRKTILILVVGFGLLPLWLAIGAVAVLIVLYWNEMGDAGIALPLLLASGFVWSKFTLGIATLTIIIYLIVPGTPQRKKLLAGTTFVACILAGAGWGATWKYKKDRLAADATREKAAAVDFVRNNATVRQMVGSDLDVSTWPDVKLDGRTGQPKQFDIAVRPADAKDYADRDARRVYAIVAVTRNGKQTNFVLKCITQLSLGKRDSRDACKDSMVIGDGAGLD